MASSADQSFFQQVNSEIQFNYPPFKYSNKLKDKCAGFLLEEEEDDWGVDPDSIFEKYPEVMGDKIGEK